MWNKIQIDVVDPKSLTENDFLSIHEITQDMWAEGMSELLICNACNNISGKKEVFWYLPQKKYNLKVSEILNWIHLKCPKCSSSNVSLTHSAQNNIPVIKDRLLNSIESSVVMVRDECYNLISYWEVYVDFFNRAINFELKPHYPSIDLCDMRYRIEEILNQDIDILTVFSAAGITSDYCNPMLFIKILKSFFQNTHFRHNNTPWIMELNKFNPVYKTFMKLGWISLNETDETFFWKNLVASPNYHSVIALFPESMYKFQSHFNLSIRDILTTS